MRVLCVCKMGRNRSKYLAEYLKAQGHETVYVGVSPYAREQLRQEHIDWAQAIITVRESFREEIFSRYQVTDKRTIALNVHDNPLLIGPSALVCKVLSPSTYQERHVYCKLRSQLEAHPAYADLRGEQHVKIRKLPMRQKPSRTYLKPAPI